MQFNLNELKRMQCVWHSVTDARDDVLCRGPFMYHTKKSAIFDSDILFFYDLVTRINYRPVDRMNDGEARILSEHHRLS